MPLTCITTPSWSETLRQSGLCIQTLQPQSGQNIFSYSWPENEEVPSVSLKFLSLLLLSAREYGSIEDVDVDLNINSNFLDVSQMQ